MVFTLWDFLKSPQISSGVREEQLPKLMELGRESWDLTPSPKLLPIPPYSRAFLPLPSSISLLVPEVPGTDKSWAILGMLQLKLNCFLAFFLMAYGFALLDSPKSVLFCSSASKKCLPLLFSFLHICMYISFKKSSCYSFPAISGRSKFRCKYSSCCPNSDVPHCFVICRYMLNSYTKDSVPQFFYFIWNISLSVPHCFTYCFF